MSKIGRTLRDGTRLLWIFQTVAVAEYFRGPRNSITTTLHYGKCQWVFKFGPLLDCVCYIGDFVIPGLFHTVYFNYLPCERVLFVMAGTLLYQRLLYWGSTVVRFTWLCYIIPQIIGTVYMGGGRS